MRFRSLLCVLLVMRVSPLFAAPVLKTPSARAQMQAGEAFAQKALKAVPRMSAHARVYVEHLKQKEFTKAQIKRLSIKLPDLKSGDKSDGIDVGPLVARYAKKWPTASNVNQWIHHDVLVFVSFSMPQKSLVSLMNELNPIGGVMLLRGLVNHSFAQTASAIKRLIGDKSGGIDIDPVLFEHFHIHAVPAVVLIKDDTNCLNHQTCQATAMDFDVVYGNVSIKAALQEMARKGVAHQKASRLLAILNKGDA